MANEEHLRRLMRSVRAWNTWRSARPEEVINLSGADLRGRDLSGRDLSMADLSNADLSRTNLSGADLKRANLSGANLSRALIKGVDLSGRDLSGRDLSEADIRGTNLSGANLRGVDLSGRDLSRTNLSGADLRETNLRGVDLSGRDLSRTNLSGADLSRANLKGVDLTGIDFRQANLIEVNLNRAILTDADLSEAILIRTNLKDAKLNNCRIYGISAWDVELTGADQSGLIITPDGEPTITVDNLKVAQFIYLMLNNAEIRDIIDTVTSKVVLILGRFTPERKAILDAIREELRKRNYLAVLFDFDKPSRRDITETVSILAHMARFIIIDITDAKSIPQELMRIVPSLPSVPVQPLLLAAQNEYGMFEHFKRFPWVLDTFLYESLDHAIASLSGEVINPLETYISK